MKVCGLADGEWAGSFETTRLPMTQRRTPVKLSELIEAVEFSSDEHAAWVDLETGCVVRVDQFLLNALEGKDDDTLEVLTEWDRDELALARAITEDSAGRFLDAPDAFGFHEYRHMQCFIESLGETEAAGRLWDAIKGSGAFRRFKNTADRLGLLTAWYRYREDALRTFVRKWAEANQVAVEDDMTRSA